MTCRSLASLLLLALTLAACGGESEDPPTAVYPAEIYTGGEDGFVYSVPVVVTDKSATFSLDAPCCTVIDQGDGEAVVEARSAGVGVLQIDTAERLIEINVTATAYTAAERAEGQADYARFSCASAMCHDPGPNDNTPSAIGEHPDDKVLLNVRTGNDPDGGIVRDFHKFQTGNGVVAYLRSLPAKGKPGPNN